MRKRLATFAALALAAGGVALLLREPVREAIVYPLSYALALARRLLDVVPQGIVWIVFVGVAALVALVTLVARARPAHRAPPGDAERRGRVERWLRWADLMIDGRNAYAYRTLRRRLAELAAGALGDRDTRDQVRGDLQAGRLDLPPDASPRLQAQLQAWLSDEPPRRSRDARSAADLEDALTFLEHQLEIGRDRQHR